MPGFPDANEDALKSIQEFNPDAAKKLLADAGFPNGDGLPEADADHPRRRPGLHAGRHPGGRREHQRRRSASRSTSRRWTRPPFMDGAAERKPTNIPFGWVTYGMDYLDATNMLSVWKSGGRHNWNNAAFDKLVTDGGADHQRPGGAHARRCRTPSGCSSRTRPACSSTTSSSASCTSRTARAWTDAEQDRLHRRPVARRRNADRHLRHALPGRRCHDDAKGVTRDPILDVDRRAPGRGRHHRHHR